MIYLDNASTTPVDESIQKVIEETLKKFGNPSNNYQIGIEAKQLIEKARTQVAETIGAESDEIYFTSGASESNSLAIHQRALCWCSPYEHHSILYNAKARPQKDLKRMLLDLKDSVYRNAYIPQLLVTHMLVNNETGEIFDIKEIAEICEELGIIFHTDATQAIGKIHIDVKKQKIKMLSLSGHKFNVPKGIGAIFIDKSIQPVVPLIYGGGQERMIRGGTENVPYIVALGEGILKANQEMYGNHFKHLTLKQMLYDELCQYENVDYQINSPWQSSIPSVVNISFAGIEGEVLAAMLADKNIFVGTGSACNTGDFKPSHVLQAKGVSDKYIRGAIRISFGKQNTKEEVLIATREMISQYNILLQTDY